MITQLIPHQDDNKPEIQIEPQVTGHKHCRSAAATLLDSEPTKACRVLAGEGMLSIANSLETVAGTVATAMENLATKIHPPLPSESTNTLAALAEMARLMCLLSPTASATTVTTDARTAAIQSIEDDEGFSDNDLTSAVTS
jgi:hypothetical protein